MADRITQLVNDVLQEEAGGPHLSPAQVLDLIDYGDSEGGAQVNGDR